MMGTLDIQSIFASSSIKTLPKGIMTIARKENIYDIYSHMIIHLHFYIVAKSKLKLPTPL